MNGTVNRDPEHPIQLERDRIAIDGQLLSAAEKIYVMLNKPRGVVTTASDEKERKTVYAFLDPSLPWLAPVGRLDKASEGLLLLTNDSEWAARITDPQSHLHKTYHVQISGAASPDLLHRLVMGIICEGVSLRARKAHVLRSGPRNAWLEIVLDEGKNRQIRRMLEALNVEVLRLVRVSIGPLSLEELKKASFRPLTKAEKLAMDWAISRRRA